MDIQGLKLMNIVLCLNFTYIYLPASFNQLPAFVIHFDIILYVHNKVYCPMPIETNNRNGVKRKGEINRPTVSSSPYNE